MVCDKMVLTCNELHVGLFGTTIKNISDSNTVESSNKLFSKNYTDTLLYK